MAGKLDPVKLAKAVAKETKVPLPKVAAVFQKYPLDGVGLKKAYEECVALGKAQLEKDLKAMFNL